jgi:hypothetical protein
MTSTNGSTTGHSADVDIDTLYSYFPGAARAPRPCPEALFSVTLRGQLDGIETLLTVRGMTAEEFRLNLAQVRGLLDAPQAPRCNGLQSKWLRPASSAFLGPDYLPLSISPGPHYGSYPLLVIVEREISYTADVHPVGRSHACDKRQAATPV